MSFYSLIRVGLASIFHQILRLTKYRNIETNEDLWNRIKDYSPELFSIEINKYPYKKDSNTIFFDNTITDPYFFFEKLENDRDCDDYARIWNFYAESNQDLFKEVYEYYIKGLTTDRQNLAHMFTVLRKRSDNKYYLCDYKYYSKGFYTIIEIKKFIENKYNIHNTKIDIIYSKIFK